MFSGCLPKKSNMGVPKYFSADTVWKEFINTTMPIICITGPNLSGKTSLAHYLSEHSSYRLLNTRNVLHSTNSAELKNIGTLVRNEIKNSFKFCTGYIIDDFPAQMSQFRIFEKKLRKPVVIIYISMSLDACLSRALVQNPTVDLNAVRIEYVKTVKFAEKLYRTHEKNKKAIKILSQHPINDTHVKAVEMLENEFAYKFKHTAKS